jgi:hypothetical protein
MPSFPHGLYLCIASCIARGSLLVCLGLLGCEFPSTPPPVASSQYDLTSPAADEPPSPRFFRFERSLGSEP